MPSINVITVDSFQELQRSINHGEAPAGTQIVLAGTEERLYASERPDEEIIEAIRALRAEILGGRIDIATFMEITVLCDDPTAPPEEVQRWLVEKLARFTGRDERSVASRVTFEGLRGFGGPTSVRILPDHRNLAHQILAD